MKQDEFPTLGTTKEELKAAEPVPLAEHPMGAHYDIDERGFHGGANWKLGLEPNFSWTRTRTKPCWTVVFKKIALLRLIMGHLCRREYVKLRIALTELTAFGG